MYKGGAWVEHEAYVKEKYGQEEVDRLKRLHFEVKQMTANDHLEVAETYKRKVKELGGWPS